MEESDRIAVTLFFVFESLSSFLRARQSKDIACPQSIRSDYNQIFHNKKIQNSSQIRNSPPSSRSISIERAIFCRRYIRDVEIS